MTPTIPGQYARTRADEAFTLGGRAFFTDDGRRERVVITSETFDAPDANGQVQAWRTVAFVDQDGDSYDVRARLLEEADDATWLVAGRKDRVLMGAPPVGPFPRLKSAPVEEVRGDPLDGVEVRSLTDDQRARLAKVDVLLAESEALARSAKAQGITRTKVGDGQRQEARRILLGLQREIAERVAAASRDEHLEELAVLERRRGAQVQDETARGGTRRIRVASRGGLQLAFERGNLDGGKVRGDVLYEVAKRYRDAYERADGMTTPTGCGVKSTEGRQLGVAVAIEDLRTMRLGMTRRQLAVVNRVCGLDMTVRATADELKAGVPATRRALRGGLTLAAENKLWC